MATLSSASSTPPLTNKYEIDYTQPPDTNNTNINIASTMIVNPSINYHFVSASSTLDKQAADSLSYHSQSSFITVPESISVDAPETTASAAKIPSPSALHNNSNVNSIAASLNNMSVAPHIDKFNFFGSNLVGNSNIGYSANLMSTAQYNAGLENKCLRCNGQVYALERIGPIKGNIYHKTCFKCLTCERQLDLKTYYTNQINLSDRQIYCQTHAPKSGKGSFGADNVHIQNVLNAPKLDLINRHDNKHKAIIDGNARHILHAINAQNLVSEGNKRDWVKGHMFPAYPRMNPADKKAREEIRKAQEILEAKQRAEEDKLLQVNDLI
jgi:hypothetical protein